MKRGSKLLKHSPCGRLSIHMREPDCGATDSPPRPTPAEVMNDEVMGDCQLPKPCVVTSAPPLTVAAMVVVNARPRPRRVLVRGRVCFASAEQQKMEPERTRALARVES